MHEKQTLLPVDILLVEDNPGDVRLAQEALKQAKLANPLHVVEDGEAALDFLHRRGAFCQAPRPGLILLDLTLPRKSGREVLMEIRQDAQLRIIPLVILISSRAEENVLRASHLHTSCFATKPIDFAQLSAIVRKMEDFWFSVVTLRP